MTLDPDLPCRIRTLFDAIHDCDIQKLNAVFPPAIQLVDAGQRSILYEPIDSFSRRRFGASVKTGAKDQPREAEVFV